MHYYQFNIGDYASHTSHLDPLEDIAYRRMLDWIYLNESPLPDNISQIARLIRMRDECERITDVLREFFELTDYGYTQKKAMREIERFNEKSKKAKEAVEKRWAKKRNKRHTDVLQTNNERNTNHKPITNNQEPLTNSKDIGSPKAPAFNFKKSLLELGADEKSLSDWLAARKKKKAANTETALKKFLAEVDKSGLTLNQVLELCAANSWSGFKSSWDYEGKPPNGYSSTTQQNIDNLRDW